MPSAFIVGGSGQIGIAIACRLIQDGWNITVGSRTSTDVLSGCEHVVINTQQPDYLKECLKQPTDVLISCLAFDAFDAQQLLSVQKSVGRIVVISSASVYQDSVGRTLDEAGECGFPVFNGPISEQTQTVAAGPQNYSTRKMLMENELRQYANVPITVLRPCAIHGPHSKHAREWWFVKRLLDGRKRIPLAYGGRSRFQTTSTAAIAEAVINSIENQLPDVLNVADADSPSAVEIGNSIMQVMNMEAELVLLADEQSYPPTKGASPWSIQHPFVCSAICRSELTYQASVEPALQWLIGATTHQDWQSLLPQLASYPYSHFDYKLDDEACQLNSNTA